MDNWIPMYGDFLTSNNNLIFKGKEIEYQPKNESETQLLMDIGHLVFDTENSQGQITTEIEFEKENIGQLFEVVVFRDTLTDRELTVGFGNSYGTMFLIREFDGKQWNIIKASGTGSNLRANTKYKLEINVKGSNIDLKVNGVHVLSTVYHSHIFPSQVGIRCIDKNDISIIDFKVVSEKPKAFIVMEFSEPFNELYNNVIKDVCSDYNIEPIRADEIYSTSMIIADIIRSIRESSLIIAEISQKNPNVFYEVGYSHALNKPTLLIADRNTKLPFDVSPFRVLFYENSIIGKDRFEKSLRKHLEELLKI